MRGRPLRGGGARARRHPRAAQGPPGEGRVAPQDAALREVREETGPRGRRPSRSSATSATGTRATATACMKIVSFFLFRYRSGQRRGPRPRGRGGALDPARGGARAARLQGRAARWPQTALSRVAQGQLVCRDRVRPQLLLAGLRRPAQARPQDRHDPPRRQGQEVPQGRGRDDHRRLPALAAREDLRGGDRLASRSRRCSDLSPRDIEHDNPEFRRLDEMVHFLEQIYGRKVEMDDVVTVVRFSQISDRPSEIQERHASRAPRPRTSSRNLPPAVWHSRC